MFHRRFSTSTFSNWPLAQTFRALGHNGEINTIKANRNAALNLESELKLSTLLMQQGSDSADMDRVVELLVSHGVTLPETLCRMMPMAWRDLASLPPEARRYFQGVQRALGSLGAREGPAAIVATDGAHLVCKVDRMGLRPLRWMLARPGRLLVASELGAIPAGFDEVQETGQLDPGEAIAVDLRERRILRPVELISSVVSRRSASEISASSGSFRSPRLRSWAFLGRSRMPPRSTSPAGRSPGCAACTTSPRRGRSRSPRWGTTGRCPSCARTGRRSPSTSSRSSRW
ncbi:MAG: hypothetical protein HYZ28_27875 [Myxococcales bacterium]|nr:hypothetical protein [Myxococcales bacterium]